MTPFLGEVVGTLLLIVLGAVLVWLTYLPHWALTADPEAKLGVLCTAATGSAINPARDFGPRLAHAVLPIPGKRDADWGYAWIPIVGPVVGGVVGALVFRALWAA